MDLGAILFIIAVIYIGLTGKGGDKKVTDEDLRKIDVLYGGEE